MSKNLRWKLYTLTGTFQLEAVLKCDAIQKEGIWFGLKIHLINILMNTKLLSCCNQVIVFSPFFPVVAMFSSFSLFLLFFPLFLLLFFFASDLIFFSLCFYLLHPFIFLFCYSFYLLLLCLWCSFPLSVILFFLWVYSSSFHPLSSIPFVADAALPLFLFFYFVLN